MRERIGLHDADGHSGFPNYALMKLSAWHKACGDAVERWNPMFRYDRVYSSKVFTFSPEDPYLPEDAVRGGTGYGKYEDLPDEIDGMFPDYSLYPKADYAIGFLTRGCIRACPWCIVPKKEPGGLNRTGNGGRSNGRIRGKSCSWTTMCLQAISDGRRWRIWSERISASTSIRAWTRG